MQLPVEYYCLQLEYAIQKTMGFMTKIWLGYTKPTDIGIVTRKRDLTLVSLKGPINWVGLKEI